MSTRIDALGIGPQLLIWLSALSLLPISCASTPPPAPLTHAGPFSPPEGGYAEVELPKVDPPDPSAGRPVSLSELLVYADAHAPEVKLARARLPLADGLIDAIPVLPDNPELEIEVGSEETGGKRHTNYSASLKQRLDITGSRGLQVEATERMKDSLQAELNEARWAVHRHVHTAFHDALIEKDAVQVADRLLHFQERLLALSEARLRAGDVPELTVRLAKGELSGARVLKISAEQRYLEARLRLSQAAGWEGAQPPDPAGRLGKPKPPPSQAKLLEIAQRQQPRLKTLEARRAQAQATLRAEDRRAWPQPTLGLTWSREGGEPGEESTELTGSLAVPLPLFRTNRASRARARSGLSVAQTEQANFQQQLGDRIAALRAEAVGAASALDTYGTEILPTFEENLRLIQRSFELGEIDVLQVSVAKERFLKIQGEALDAYRRYFSAIAALQGAIGADLWPGAHDHAQAPANSRGHSR